jgi:hypothetical protein
LTLETDTTPDMMAAPTRQVENGKTVPRRAGTRSMIPTTWLARSLRVEYVGAAGDAKEITATLLDWCPLGLLLSIAGAKCLLAYERVVMCELIED